MRVWIKLGPREFRLFSKVILKGKIKINNRYDYYSALTLSRKVPLLEFDGKELVLKGTINLEKLRIRKRKSKRLPYMIRF